MERVPTCRKRLLLLWGHESYEEGLCPRRTTEGAHGQRIEVQSQQQSVIVNRLVRPTQSWTSLLVGGPEIRRGRLRVGYIT